MSFAVRHRYPSLHWLIFIGLVLAMILQPFLAAVSEVHELTHGSELHQPADRPVDLQSAPVVDREKGDRDADTLHLVHALGHCCGLVAATATAFNPAVAQLNLGPIIPTWTLERPDDEPKVAPFRPPIVA